MSEEIGSCVTDRSDLSRTHGGYSSYSEQETISNGGISFKVNSGRWWKVTLSRTRAWTELKKAVISIEVVAAMGLYSDDFAQVFSKLLEKTGISCYQLSQYTHLNQAYLSRLRNGKKQNPSPETVVKISLALCYYSNQVQLHDIENLFKSVGRSIITREVWILLQEIISTRFGIMAL